HRRGRESVLLDHEVGASRGRPQEGNRGAAPPSVPDRPLTATEAFLVLAVVILGEGPVGLSCSIEPGVEQRISVARIDDRERPAAAAPGGLALLPRLAPLEVGEDLGVRPAETALLRPSVVVAAMA